MPTVMKYNEDIFINKIDYCKVLVDYVYNRICKQQKNFISNISGGTGTGKSFSSIYIAEEIQKKTLPNIPFNANQIVFRGTDFMRLIMGNNALPSGSVIIWDEIGIGLNAKKAMSSLNIALNNTFQVFRSKRYVILTSTPDHAYIDKSTRKLLHCYLNTVELDYKHKVNKVNCQLMQFNPKLSKTYYHNFHLAVKGKPLVRLRNIYTGMPNKELISEYEEKKEIFNQKIFKHTLNIIKKYDDMEPLTEKQQIIYDMNQKGMNQNEIAESLDIGRVGITKTLQMIEKKGYEIKRYTGSHHPPYKIQNAQ